MDNLSRWPSAVCCCLLLLFCCRMVAAEGAAPITVVSVESAPLPAQLMLSASVESRRHTLISVEIAGMVSEMLVDEGERVDQGEPLLRLRDQPIRLTAEFQQARQQRAEADVHLAGLKEKRQAELLQSQAAAQDSYDVARAELQRAAADLTAARASVALTADELARHTVNAPFAGVVSRKQTELGSWVRPGDPLLLLEETAVLRVTVPVPQNYFDQVDEGAKVRLEFAALPGESVNAQVTRKVASANPASRTFPILIDLDNPQNRLAPGMSAQAHITLAGGDEPVLQVKVDAVVRRPDGTILLWKIVEDGELLRAVPAPVRLGRSLGERVEIIAGPVAAGDRVVEQGNERMRPQLPVRILARH
ncbi:MAG TPA: hypothetical protein DCF45_05865 [Gammaproteobacteria bacterium]|nr:hypothetical protein [Gammaproteobacteria bacterium]